MSNTPLPKQVDVRKLAATGAIITAREPLASFRRLCGMLESDAGDVEVRLHFFTDEQGMRRIDGSVRAQVQVLCQRCLQPLPVDIDSTFAAAVVWSDDDAGQVPRQCDPYIAGDEPQDVRDLIEDELIISLPFVSYHAPEQCVPAGYTQQPAGEAPAERENPFKVLEQLKPGK